MIQIKEDFPEKKFFSTSDKMICYNMKKNTIELLHYVLEHLDDKTFEIKVPTSIAKRALKPIERMLEFS